MASSTVRLNQAYESAKDVDYSGRAISVCRGRRLLFLIVLVGVIALVVGLLIGRFAIPHDKSSEEKLLRALSQEADADVSETILNAISPRNIEENLKILSQKPHIAGRQGDFDLVKFIRERFQSYGLGVQVTPYDVLLSYPNDEVANSVRLLSSNGDIVYDSVQNESDISHLEGVVPPFNAYSPARKVEGKLAFVNYGRVDDYTWLQSRGINVTGHIVLAKLGRIFRGDIVDIAAANGAIGVVTFPDPADYTGVNNGDRRYAPDALWMPPDGIQRGTIFTGFADPLTPGYPANSKIAHVIARQH
ncbi:N-acetylated-alpha-linked acidic dipeptidase 2 [Plakobranchus ocellatus]|uniref:N-acetylated-alpha-linked acidic dipeptidase 2 n=1 Tax=Plakobranchus ocellatus TaxID=259542 RepID=A0AAV4BRM0_9GAST|nr:N-acetylated-alpha-linked acidic dipeptidase 2 [Plakobranchus ocellatus]